MFNIESYVTPILLSYVDKYVKDFKPADAQVSLWAGGVALHNLVLKTDVLQQEVSLPFTFISGRIHELLILVPWTKIISEPIVVTIDTIECILGSRDTNTTEETVGERDHGAAVIQTPPGYMQALVRRIFSNISLKIHHLILKYVEDDIVLSLNVKNVTIDSAGANWEPAFTDNETTIRRLIKLEDVTLCLDHSDADGKIRFYQEPLLYKSQISFRMVTQLVSANIRRPSSVNIQLDSSKLAWGVSSEQLQLLYRLIKKHDIAAAKRAMERNREHTAKNHPASAPIGIEAEATDESNNKTWSKWAWSWLPIGTDEVVIDSLPSFAPIPVYFSAFVDSLIVEFKIVEKDPNQRKRYRGILELLMSHMAVNGFIVKPTMLKCSLGIRSIELQSKGKCVCRYNDNALNQETIYFTRYPKKTETDSWEWPSTRFKEKPWDSVSLISKESLPSLPKEQIDIMFEEEEVVDKIIEDEHEEMKYDDEFWTKMSPVLLIKFAHDRSPPNAFINPYENPPTTFMNSNWIEDCQINVFIAPVQLSLCTGLIHRALSVVNILKDTSKEIHREFTKPIKLALTVDEFEALSENLPQRRMSFTIEGFHVIVTPSDHKSHEHNVQSPLLLDLALNKATLQINVPLYPLRVCTAACQVPEDSGQIWRGARTHLCLNVSCLQARLIPVSDDGIHTPKLVARTEAKVVLHVLQHQELFSGKTVQMSYITKLKELNVCGSRARLAAALQITESFLHSELTVDLRNTTLAHDALHDEEAVAVDITLEDLTVRGYATKTIQTHIGTLHSVRATALRASAQQEIQVWLFSGSDAPKTSPYIRVAVQYCQNRDPDVLDYIGVLMEPTSVSFDPLLISWLSYKPQLKYIEHTRDFREHKSYLSLSSKPVTSKQTMPLSSGRGATRSASAEYVHSSRARSRESSEFSEIKPPITLIPEKENKTNWWDTDNIKTLYDRLHHVLVDIKIGMVQLYFTTKPVSALNCASVVDAMDNHTGKDNVLTVSMGCIKLTSNNITTSIWNIIRLYGPTVIQPGLDSKNVDDSFPWKLSMADISSYTLNRESDSKEARGVPNTKNPVEHREILQLFQTTITLTIVGKRHAQKKLIALQEKPKHHGKQNTEKEKAYKYFKSGLDFKPNSLKEFFRGPNYSLHQADVEEHKYKTEMVEYGPLLSLAVNVHADTTPVVIKLDQDQIHMIGLALHCFTHIATLLNKQTVETTEDYTSIGGSRFMLARSVSDTAHLYLRDTETTTTGSDQSDNMPYSRKQDVVKKDMVCPLWFQWVISHGRIAVITDEIKLVFTLDDIISTADIQPTYRQFKLKIAAVALKYYQKDNAGDWKIGELGGNVLMNCEPTSGKEDDNFFTLTITQAYVDNLPVIWKENEKSNSDQMWEINMTVAPLEGAVRPLVVRNIAYILSEMSPQAMCWLKDEQPVRRRPLLEYQWPLLHVTIGGLQLIIIDDNRNAIGDDALQVSIGKIVISPHPENPIYRRAAQGDSGVARTANGAVLEGRQYEITAKNISISSTLYKNILKREREQNENTGGEIPAAKWAHKAKDFVFSPVLKPVVISCVLAPPIVDSGTIICGPAIEFNVTSELIISLSLRQFTLCRDLIDILRGANTDNYVGDDNEFDDNEDNEDSAMKHVRHTLCPYKNMLFPPIPKCSVATDCHYEYTVRDIDRNTDSGVESSLNYPMRTQLHRLSYEHEDEGTPSLDYLEVYITMGVIKFIMFVSDDNSSNVNTLKLLPERSCIIANKEQDTSCVMDNPIIQDTSIVAMRMTVKKKLKLEAKPGTSNEGKEPEPQPVEQVPMFQLNLIQPNLYFYRKQAYNNLQMSLYNASFSFGSEKSEWHLPVFTTGTGSPDLMTDIPPALFTFTYSTSNYRNSGSASGNRRAAVKIDVERPVLLHVSIAHIKRLHAITVLLNSGIQLRSKVIYQKRDNSPLVHKLRNFLVDYNLESITVRVTQTGIEGAKGTVSIESGSLQIMSVPRPEQITATAHVSSFQIALEAIEEMRRIFLLPTCIGCEMDASWGSWRKSESIMDKKDVLTRVILDLDRLNFSMRPNFIPIVNTIIEGVKLLRHQDEVPKEDSYTLIQGDIISIGSHANIPDSSSDNYYQDDLRSGAFKILTSDKLPFAYQIVLHENSVSWRYPHPRGIMKIIAHPLPDQDTEVDCVLEYYNIKLQCWQAHTYFQIPVDDTRQFSIFLEPPKTIFASIWRFRTYDKNEEQSPHFEFDLRRYFPKDDPLYRDTAYLNTISQKPPNSVTAQQLSGVIQIDSFYGPKLLPLSFINIRISALRVRIYNSKPDLEYSQTKSCEGYYVSKPLRRSHQMLYLIIKDTLIESQSGSPAGSQVRFTTDMSSTIFNCWTGTLDPLIEQARIQAAFILYGQNLDTAQLRFRTEPIRILLHLPRLRTIQALVSDWKRSLAPPMKSSEVKELTWEQTAEVLEGRVSLWVHNECAVALKIGQDATEEALTIGPGIKLAYRWYNPESPKRIHFSFAGPKASNLTEGIAFIPGQHRLKIDDPINKTTGESTLFVRVVRSGAKSTMYLSGRLTLANLMREELMYKIRVQTVTDYETTGTGTLSPTTINHSILCSSDRRMILKIKYPSSSKGWSGDIPIKECPKQNVPWLVKVPVDGDVPYKALWCRIVYGRKDDRIIAMLWPLYIFRSHLPLDTDLLINTEVPSSSEDLNASQLTPVIQDAPGRGNSVHLAVAGTTTAKHMLSLQYRKLQCPVTEQALPLHYGVMEKSVFDHYRPTNYIEDIINEVSKWLDKHGVSKSSQWPYSIVTHYWHGRWQASHVQPRCEISLKYNTVFAGGGCSLEAELCPMVLICNASTLLITLRAHDASPICRLEPGDATTPPSVIIQKPFFISFERGKDTFVSSQIEVWHGEAGIYGSPPPDCVGLDHPLQIAINLHQEIALLTIYYEIKHNINIIGISSTYFIVNELSVDVSISVLTKHKDQRTHAFRPLDSETIKPFTGKKSDVIQLPTFYIHDRFFETKVEELLTYVAVSFGKDSEHSYEAVPIRLNKGNTRRSIGIRAPDGRSYPVEVTVQSVEGRRLITIAHDTCPQFMIHNQTKLRLAFGEPIMDTKTLGTKCVPECEGLRWICAFAPYQYGYYSTPSYSDRYPPKDGSKMSITQDSVIAISRIREVFDLIEWSFPVIVTSGEQLVQLPAFTQGISTLKVKIHAHPHTTLIELVHVDFDDISAIDVRNKISFSRQDMSKYLKNKESGSEQVLTENKSTESAFTSDKKDDDFFVNSAMTSQIRTDMSTSRTTWYKKSQAKITFQESSLFETSEANMFGDVAQEFYHPNSFIASTGRLIGLNFISRNDWQTSERICGVISGIVVEMALSPWEKPLLAVNLERVGVLVSTNSSGLTLTMAVSEVQADNLQQENDQYEFTVVATTLSTPHTPEIMTPVSSMFAETDEIMLRRDDAHLFLSVRIDQWHVGSRFYNELTEVEAGIGPIAFYIEDAYVRGVTELMHSYFPHSEQDESDVLVQAKTQKPFTLRSLYIRPIDLTLTLHTAVRMYIALDQSPLYLTEFRIANIITSMESLSHALTVHYLSALVLSAGWVVGGLELLGAPGALAARVSNARGGVRGVASTTAAALLQSLCAWAGSLARNLDLLTGDEEHARRAAAARRKPPPTLVAGVMAGLSNFAINILGAVGGLAHHPLVSVAAGETDSSAKALRRGLVGVLAKPLSATADLVAFAGSGLLSQTGWNALPRPRDTYTTLRALSGWDRDCVRWKFRLDTMDILTGFNIRLDDTVLLMLLTRKVLILVDSKSERILRVIDVKQCTLLPLTEKYVEIRVTQPKKTEDKQETNSDDPEAQLSATALARVALYTGSEPQSSRMNEVKILKIVPGQRFLHIMHAILDALINFNSDTHLKLL